MTARDRQRGAALIIVLWTALFLALVMAAALATARIEAKIAAARAERLKADVSLRSALDLAAWRVASGDYDEVAGGPIIEGLELNGYTVEVAFSPEQNKLDINLAEERALMGFFESSGLKRNDAERLAAEIADWRDTDDLPRPNGAERRDYAGARNKQIGDRPFRGLPELHDVLHITPDLYCRIAPSLTIFGKSGSAPRAEGASGSAPTGQRLGTAARGAIPGERYIVRAVAVKDGAPPAELSMAFRATGNQGTPFETIFVFREIEPRADECGPPS